MRRSQLVDFIELLLGFIGLVAGIISIYNYISGDRGFAVLLTVIVFAFAIVITLRLFSLRKIAIGRLQGFANAIHKINHLVRDEYHGICVQYKLKNLTKNSLEKNLKLVGQKIVECISNALQDSSGEKIFVSIRYFCSDEKENKTLEVSEEDLKALPIRVLCRSSNSPQKDDENQLKIKKHTDIMHILLDEKDHFFVTDLKKYRKDLLNYHDSEYVDPNVGWENMYISKITVPIRIKKKLIDHNFKGENFEVIGFLTITSPSRSAFPKETKEPYLNFCKGCADSLFVYFERYLYFYMKL